MERECMLKSLDRKSRKTIAMHRALHLKGDSDRLYVKKKVEGRGLERCVREEENSLGFYVANSEENLIREGVAAKTINTEHTVMNGEFKKQ